jgi:hypothetical protein
VGKGGRPPRQWRWLVHDVNRVIARRGGSVSDACAFLADGGFPEVLPIYTANTTIPQLKGVSAAKVVWGKWAGMEVPNLERRYYEQKSPQKYKRKSPKNKFCSTA